MKIALVFALCACGHVALPTCTTKAGLTVVGAIPRGWCDDLQRTEDLTLKAFATLPHVDPRFATAARRISGYTISVRPEAAWTQEITGRFVMGECACWYKQITIGNEAVARGALPHELAHAVQNCEPMPPPDAKDPDHANWGPIREALDKVLP